MGQKEKILSLLQDGKSMTQGELAEAMYGDTMHRYHIYTALMGLVKSGAVGRAGSYPARYFLSGAPAPTVLSKSEGKEKKYRDVSKDIICNETIDEVSRLVEETDNYGPENQLVCRCLQRFPENRDPDIVAMKIGLIDITNSTHLSQYKSRISMDELSRIIAAIPDIDVRIAQGDPQVVNDIARSNERINLFSFASKYCCYHNFYQYGRDDYSILDNVVKKYLPRYFADITQNQIQKWQNGFAYEKYNDYITRKLNELGITTPNRKRKFDHFIWYKNR